MISVTTYINQTIFVLGLGKTGLSTARALQAGGATVLGWDDSPQAQDKAIAQGITLQPNPAWPDINALCLSPGIPHRADHCHPYVEAARAHQVPVIGDIELLTAMQPQATFVGITGTNGKSTTTALIGHILKKANRIVEVGGNIGTAALDLNALGSGGIYVLELSSYQLELFHHNPIDIGILLNITPDHLAHHGTMGNYIAAKARLFKSDKPNFQAIIAIDDDPSRAIARSLQTSIQPILISKDHPFHIKFKPEHAPQLRGAHNWQNMAAAYECCRQLGLLDEEIFAGIKSFPGLAHRQELITTPGAIKYINDSKATNADAAAPALAAYDNIYWILGGKAKTGGIETLAPYFSKVKKAFLIGESQDDFAKTLEGTVEYYKSGTLETAVKQAIEAAQDDPLPGVVLLSPACASWDQYRSFEERGDHFKALVKEMAVL